MARDGRRRNGFDQKTGENGGVLKKMLAQGMGQVLDALDEGVFIVDADGVTVFLNAAIEKVDGCFRREMLGKNLLELFPSLTRETSTLWRALSEGRSIGAQLQTYTNIHGRQITTVNHTVPIFCEGRIIGAAEIARDISVIRKLQDKVMDLQDALTDEHVRTRYTLADILGRSEGIRRVVEYARRAARSSSNILIYGESGTGKEMLAQGIHHASVRRGHPFIAHNCAALPEGLMEGILFGTCRGSFTGAVDRAGLFEQAHRGTMLLDEVNSIGADLQAKFLRVLQEKKIRRLGDSREREVDVRIIATVNTDPAVLLRNGELRRDLFYRLSVVNIVIPPLRERLEDIPLLTDFFIARYNELFNMAVPGVSPAVQDFFASYHWPGNVRELMHVIEGAMNIMEGGGIIGLEHLPAYLRAPARSGAGPWTAPDHPPLAPRAGVPGQNGGGSLNQVVQNIERSLIEKTLQETGYNFSKSARILGIKRQTLQYKVIKYNLYRA